MASIVFIASKHHFQSHFSTYFLIIVIDSTFPVWKVRRMLVTFATVFLDVCSGDLKCSEIHFEFFET